MLSVPFYRLQFIALSSPHSKAQISPVMLFLWQVKSDRHLVVWETHLLHGCPGNTGAALAAHRQSWSGWNAIAPSDKDQERPRIGKGSWGSWGVTPHGPGDQRGWQTTGGRGAKLRSRAEIWRQRRGWTRGQEVGRWESSVAGVSCSSPLPPFSHPATN